MAVDANVLIFRAVKEELRRATLDARSKRFLPGLQFDSRRPPHHLDSVARALVRSRQPAWSKGCRPPWPIGVCQPVQPPHGDRSLFAGLLMTYPSSGARPYFVPLASFGLTVLPPNALMALCFASTATAARLVGVLRVVTAQPAGLRSPWLKPGDRGALAVLALDFTGGTQISLQRSAKPPCSTIRADQLAQALRETEACG